MQQNTEPTRLLCLWVKRGKLLGDQLAACFTPRMIAALALVGVSILIFLLAWLPRRMAARVLAGEAGFVRVMANLPAKGRRYSLGLVRAEGEFQWEPRWSWTRLRELPTDLRYTGARVITAREGLWLSPGGLVIECESSAGPVLLWVRAAHVEHIMELIRRTGTPDDASVPVPDINS
ncbi:hypothetical protein ABT167_16040 [Streptomyces sp. NPDC001792]|uniref:hypothetical protein n=1 Tax=Streptomyces sp. NPDC001792 TaxID=3154524 RepID=UPI00333060A8